MSDLDEWEIEAEEQDHSTKKEVNNIYAGESEKVVVDKKAKMERQVREGDDPEDLDAKWEKKQKPSKTTQNRAEIMADHSLTKEERNARLQELNDLDMMDDDLLADAKGTEFSNALETEADFKKLASDICDRIRHKNKPKAFTLAFLRDIMEELAPSLDGIQLNKLSDSLKVITNTKIKAETGKATKKKKAPKKEIVVSNVNKGKLNVRNEIDEFAEEFGDDREEENDDEDDFM